MSDGNINIVFSIDYMKQVFRISKTHFYKHKIEPETAEFSTLSRITNYLSSYVSSQPQPQPQPKSKKKPVNSLKYVESKT